MATTFLGFHTSKRAHVLPASSTNACYSADPEDTLSLTQYRSREESYFEPDFYGSYHTRGSWALAHAADESYEVGKVFPNYSLSHRYPDRPPSAITQAVITKPLPSLPLEYKEDVIERFSNRAPIIPHLARQDVNERSPKLLSEVNIQEDIEVGGLWRKYQPPPLRDTTRLAAPTPGEAAEQRRKSYISDRQRKAKAEHKSDARSSIHLIETARVAYVGRAQSIKVHTGPDPQKLTPQCQGAHADLQNLQDQEQGAAEALPWALYPANTLQLKATVSTTPPGPTHSKSRAEAQTISLHLGKQRTLQETSVYRTERVKLAPGTDEETLDAEAELQSGQLLDPASPQPYEGMTSGQGVPVSVMPDYQVALLPISPAFDKAKVNNLIGKVQPRSRTCAWMPSNSANLDLALDLAFDFDFSIPTFNELGESSPHPVSARNSTPGAWDSFGKGLEADAVPGNKTEREVSNEGEMSIGKGKQEKLHDIFAYVMDMPDSDAKRGALRTDTPEAPHNYHPSHQI